MASESALRGVGRLAAGEPRETQLGPGLGEIRPDARDVSELPLGQIVRAKRRRQAAGLQL